MATDLERFRDHCREMAASPEASAVDRDRWQMLAAEAEAYLRDGLAEVEPGREHAALF